MQKAYIVGFLDNEHFEPIVLCKSVEAAIDSAKKMSIQVRVANLVESDEIVDCKEHDEAPALEIEPTNQVIWPLM